MIARVIRTLSGIALLAALSPSPALADTILAPFVGRTFAGGARDDFGSSSHFTYGGTLTVEGHLLGIEIDGQYSPHFFGGASRSNVASLMAGLTVGAGDPAGPRLYGFAGAGILRSRVAGHDDFFDTNRSSFGIVVGGSVIVPVGPILGVKGDLRYFRGLSNVDPDRPEEIDLTGFHFFRVSVGLAIRL